MQSPEPESDSDNLNGVVSPETQRKCHGIFLTMDGILSNLPSNVEDGEPEPESDSDNTEDTDADLNGVVSPETQRYLHGIFRTMDGTLSNLLPSFRSPCKDTNTASSPSSSPSSEMPSPGTQRNVYGIFKVIQSLCSSLHSPCDDTNTSSSHGDDDGDDDDTLPLRTEDFSVNSAANKGRDDNSLNAEDPLFLKDPDPDPDSDNMDTTEAASDNTDVDRLENRTVGSMSHFQAKREKWHSRSHSRTKLLSVLPGISNDAQGSAE
jgi:hypothetical protein